MGANSKTKVTEETWWEIFALRCRSKRGETLSSQDQKLCATAYKADPARYKAMDSAVFEATKPFGSKREKV